MGVVMDEPGASLSPSRGDRPGDEVVPDEPLPIVVACRIRPNPQNGPVGLWAHPTRSTVTFLQAAEEGEGGLGGLGGAQRSESLNYVFNESSSQETVFEVSIRQFLALVQVGYDLTLMAYGPAGTGKTHTLVGADLPLAMNEVDFGLVPRTIRAVFHSLAHMPGLSELVARVGFMDVDNDQVRDLLSNDGHNRVEFGLNQDPGHKDYGQYTVLKGLSLVDCHSIEDVIRCLEVGLTVHRVRLNSSHDLLSDLARGSHNIFSVQFIQTYREDDYIKRVSSTVRFVDLAPSDQLFSPPSRLAPKSINHGLLALTNVVSALGDARLNTSTPYYGDSLLTKILSDSLGGSSLMVILCCVSPLEADLVETVNALEFVKKASNIRNQPKPNVSFMPWAQGGGDESRRESDMSQIRSASINHGFIPPLSAHSSKPSSLLGYAPNDNPTFPSVISNPSHPMAMNDPVLLAIQLQQLQLQQHFNHILASRVHHNGNYLNPQLVSQPPLVPPGPPGSGFHAILADPLSLSNSVASHAMSPFTLHSPLPVSYYLPTPLLGSAAPHPPPDPASIPVSIDTEALERMNREMAASVGVASEAPEEDPVKLNMVRQKLESIVEESESPLMASKSTASHPSRQAPSEEGESDEESDATSEDDDEFDSEASIVSNEEDLEREMLQLETCPPEETPIISVRLQRFCLETQEQVDAYHSHLEQRSTTAARMAQFEDGSPRERDAPGTTMRQIVDLEETNRRLMRQLEKESVQKQSLEVELCQMMRNMNVVSAQYEELEKSMEHKSEIVLAQEAEKRASVSLNCDLLRKAKSKLWAERAFYEEQFQNIKRELVANQGDKSLYEATVGELEASEAKRAHLDELVLACDWAIEYKNDVQSGQAIDYSPANADYPDHLMMKIICELLPEERNALLHKFLNRSVDLRVEQAHLERHCDTLTYNIEQYKKESNNLFHRLVLKSQKYKEALKTQERENAKKTKVLANVIEELRDELKALEARKKELKQNNQLLMNFYRHHRHCRSSGPSASNPGASNHHGGGPVKETKPNVEIRDQKLVISKTDPR